MSTNRASHIIHYNSSHLSSTDQVRFFYDLRGRGDNPGILIDTKSTFLAKSVVQVPDKSLPVFKYFLKKWGCAYRLIKVSSKADATHKLFVFDSSNLKGAVKVNFFYKLRGRAATNGIVQTTKSDYLARSVLLVPAKNYFEVVKFFREWNCDFKITEVQLRAK
jgi:hypothetical protein